MPLSARSGEREGPIAKRWEGEVCTHLTRSLRSHPLPPQAGGEGSEDRY